MGRRRRLRVAWEGWHYWRSWGHVRRGSPRYRSYVIGPLRFWLARQEARDDRPRFDGTIWRDGAGEPTAPPPEAWRREARDE